MHVGRVRLGTDRHQDLGVQNGLEVADEAVDCAVAWLEAQLGVPGVVCRSARVGEGEADLGRVGEVGVVRVVDVWGFC